MRSDLLRDGLSLSGAVGVGVIAGGVASGPMMAMIEAEVK